MTPSRALVDLRISDGRAHGDRVGQATPPRAPRGLAPRESHRNPGKIAVKVVAHTGMEMTTVEEMAKHP